MDHQGRLFYCQGDHCPLVAPLINAEIVGGGGNYPLLKLLRIIKDQDLFLLISQKPYWIGIIVFIEDQRGGVTLLRAHSWKQWTGS